MKGHCIVRSRKWYVEPSNDRKHLNSIRSLCVNSSAEADSNNVLLRCATIVMYLQLHEHRRLKYARALSGQKLIDRLRWKTADGDMPSLASAESFFDAYLALLEVNSRRRLTTLSMRGTPRIAKHPHSIATLLAHSVR